MRSFWEMVDALSKTHPIVIQTDDGSATPMVDALLDQLHDAIFPSAESMGGGAFSAKLPIDAGAVSLEMQIDHEITEAWGQAFDHRVPGIESTKTLLRHWAAKVGDNDVFDITTRIPVEGQAKLGTEVTSWRAIDLVAQWERRIDGFFNPPEEVPLRVSCVACGARWRQTWKDGEKVYVDVLKFIRDPRTHDTIGVQCTNPACQAHWGPDKFEWLWRALGHQAQIDAENGVTRV